MCIIDISAHKYMMLSHEPQIKLYTLLKDVCEMTFLFWQMHWFLKTEYCEGKVMFKYLPMSYPNPAQLQYCQKDQVLLSKLLPHTLFAVIITY